LLAKCGSRADFVVVPDIVGGGQASLDLSRSWLDELLATVICPVLIPVQEGMTPADFDGVGLGARVGLFVGGAPGNEDTRYEGEPEWKELTLPVWGDLAREAGCWLHVGRVNTARRIHLCLPWAHSFDGTSASKYVKNIGLLDRARKARVAPPFRGPTTPWGSTCGESTPARVGVRQDTVEVLDHVAPGEPLASVVGARPGDLQAPVG